MEPYTERSVSQSFAQIHPFIGCLLPVLDLFLTVVLQYLFSLLSDVFSYLFYDVFCLIFICLLDHSSVSYVLDVVALLLLMVILSVFV